MYKNYRLVVEIKNYHQKIAFIRRGKRHEYPQRHLPLLQKILRNSRPVSSGFGNLATTFYAFN